MAVITKAKEIKNVVVGEAGLMFNMDETKQLATHLATGKLVFDSDALKADGWQFFGVTGNDTKFTQDIKMFEVKVGVPEFTLKRFVVGKDGAISGHFKEVDTEINKLLAGNTAIKNIFPTANTAVTITAVDANAKTVTVAAADAGKFTVGNTVVVDADASLATSVNTARITAKATSTDCVLTFSESWFRTLPTTSMKIRQPSYSVAQLGTDSITSCQVVRFYETFDGVQFIYHFPLCEFTPNVSPSLGGTSEEMRMPFELKMEGTPNDEHFDGETNILGYFYELLARS